MPWQIPPVPTNQKGKVNKQYADGWRDGVNAAQSANQPKEHELELAMQDGYQVGLNDGQRNCPSCPPCAPCPVPQQQQQFSSSLPGPGFFSAMPPASFFSRPSGGYHVPVQNYSQPTFYPRYQERATFQESRSYQSQNPFFDFSQTSWG